MIQWLADVDYARQVMRDLKGAYKVLVNRDYYVPKLQSKCITEEYLIESLKGKLFYIPLIKVTLANMKDPTFSKLDLFNQF